MEQVKKLRIEKREVKAVRPERSGLANPLGEARDDMPARGANGLEVPTEGGAGDGSGGGSEGPTPEGQKPKFHGKHGAASFVAHTANHKSSKQGKVGLRTGKESHRKPGKRHKGKTSMKDLIARAQETE